MITHGIETAVRGNPTLRIKLSGAGPQDQPHAAALDVASTLAAVDALGRLSVDSVRSGKPLVEIVRAWAVALPPPSIARVQSPSIAVWWATRRVWGRTLAADKERDLRPPSLGCASKDGARLLRLKYGSPLEMVMTSASSATVSARQWQTIAPIARRRTSGKRSAP